MWHKSGMKTLLSLSPIMQPATESIIMCILCLGVLTGRRMWVRCINAGYLLATGDRLCATLRGCMSSEVCPITGSDATVVLLSSQV